MNSLIKKVKDAEDVTLLESVIDDYIKASENCEDRLVERQEWQQLDAGNHDYESSDYYDIVKIENTQDHFCRLIKDPLSKLKTEMFSVEDDTHSKTFSWF